jgi:hypothetical protein
MWAAALLVAAALPARCDTTPVFQRGMVFGLFARDDPGHTDSGLAEMQALGADSISIMIPWVTPDVRSLRMAPRGDMTPSDASLRYTIRKARARGMTVLLMPFLYVDKMETGEWRGTIQPPDWTAWFEAYEAFVLHYAELAGRENVEYFSVGSELCSTEPRREDWVELIRKVREVYKGKVTYSANWDHRDDLSFVDALDLLGMNAYFKLTGTAGAPEADLLVAWSAIKRDVDAWRGRLGKRLLITEVGYPSRAGAGIDPWNYETADSPDLQEQLRCYRAFQKTWSGEQDLEGVYFYVWWGSGGPEDAGYTPRGKPAADVIREWYRP